MLKDNVLLNSELYRIYFNYHHLHFEKTNSDDVCTKGIGE